MTETPIGEKPWLVIAAIDWLESVLRPDTHLFEWGMGGSTLWFASRVKSVYSVEHDWDWYQAVARACTKRGLSNVYLHHVPEHPGMEAEYAHVIHNADHEAFDAILIDGKNGTRGLCAAEAVKRVRPGGFVMLDNSGAEEHKDARAILDATRWSRRSWVGLVYAVTTSHEGTTETSVWSVPSA
jgi:predicted O-methyltransferase YrrM